MYWILIEKSIAASEIEESLNILFPELHFHYLDDSKEDWFEDKYYHCKDGKNYTYSVNKWTETIRTKIEFHDLEATTAIRMTQYIALFLSKTYQTIAVTEFEGDDSYISYRSLMIDQDKLVIINDEGIEFDNFKFNELRGYEGTIPKFDGYGRL